MLFDPEKSKSFDLKAFLHVRNPKEKRFPEMVACAKALKQEHGFKKVGAIGYCYGGWAVFQLGGKGMELLVGFLLLMLMSNPGQNLVDCVSTGHPSLLTKEEINNVAVPVQILAPEHDIMLTSEMKDYCNSTIPTLDVPYDYQYFPGSTHGFAVRCNDKDEGEKKAFERAKNAAVAFFTQFLHLH